MSKPLAKADRVALEQAVIRTRWLDELRTRPARQCQGLKRHKCDATGRFLYWQVCGMALLGEILYGPVWWSKFPGEDDIAHLYAIGAKAGLSSGQVAEVIALNDGHGIDWWDTGIEEPRDFDHLADVIEGWFA